MIDYWDQLSPYHAHIESIMGINAKSLAPLMHVVRSPVLVVGAGQGLLVEELRQKGFVAEGVDLSASMISEAARRRGIKLVHANAEDMPFEDGRFGTSIVATGVVDFTDDEERIRSIINEVRRVTAVHGEVLIAFYSFTPQGEEMLRYTGVITKEDRYDIRLSLSWLFGVEESQVPVRNDPNKSTAGLILRIVRAFLADPKGFLEQGKHVNAVRKLIKRGELSAPDALLETTERPPYRNGQKVRELFTRLAISTRGISALGNCNVVRL